jgi:hypothetical protein
MFRIGRKSSLIGVAVLATCVLTAQASTALLGSGNISRFLEESLIILGWVANWRPIEIFLYDWWQDAAICIAVWLTQMLN